MSRTELISPEVAVFIQVASSACAIPRCSAAGSVLRGISRSLGKAVTALAIVLAPAKGGLRTDASRRRLCTAQSAKYIGG